MDTKNCELLHGLLFATFVVILVYCGEQVKQKPNIAVMWCFKSSAIVVATAFATQMASFIPAIKSKKHEKLADKYDAVAKNLKDSGQEYAVDQAIASYERGLQNANNFWNQILTTISSILAVISVIIFAIGVCLL